MNLRDLQYLVAVADHGQFQKAALACHVSQPTLSMQLKKLEESLGVQLLERNNKRLLITPAGESIVRKARRIMEEAEGIKSIAKAARDPFAGEVSFGAFPTLAPYAFPRLVAPFKRQLPKLQLMLVEEKTDTLLSRLKDGTLDCAMIALPVADESLMAMPVFDEAFYLAVPNRHRRFGGAVRPEDLAKENVLLLDEGHCLRDQALEFCGSIGTGESRIYRGSSLETLRSMVLQGAGVTIMPELAIRPKEDYVFYLPFADPAPHRRIALVWRKTSGRAALFERLADIILETMAFALKQPVVGPVL